MSEIISKELLSEVLAKELKRHNSAFVEVTDAGISNNVVHINYKNTYGIICLFIINIYELQHKCKEWATEKGYEIVETTFMIRIKKVGQGKQKIWEYPREMQDAGIYFSPSFTFKACQWILDNKEI